MAEYIEREKAIMNSREYNLGGSYDNTELAAPVDVINAIPAADVRPVVLCKDCMMRQYCKVAQYLGADGFCSNGEKRKL